MSKVDTFLAGDGLPSRLLYRVCRAIVTTVVRLFTRMRIEGREHVPATGAFVLAPVHRSIIDTPIAACVTTRRLRFMGKDSVWKVRPVGWVASALGAFPVSRGTADREALRRGVAVLEMGEALVLFPEGERKSGPVVQPLFDGAVYIAVKAGVPIVPVGIGGSEPVLPKGAKLPRPRRVRVVVGPPIPPPVEQGGRVPRSVLRAHSDALHTELQRLFDEAERRAR
ncbi:MAG: 1-acyl-sn-glycerol-3-phosphate acyltransferase [Nocardiopsis sp. BM-2018]|nr:MAG: 1-acyl-sn-glycerol-3-phosphate acyltransferase [Nocardiopsis sp. BM-2018]